MATTTGYSSEKAGYNLNNNGQELTNDPTLAGKRRNSVNEGTEMYGDIGSVEEYGYVERALKSRHIQFIALGGTIGTGLFGMFLRQTGRLSLPTDMIDSGNRRSTLQIRSFVYSSWLFDNGFFHLVSLFCIGSSNDY